MGTTQNDPASGVALLDWDGVFREGFLLLDWSAFLVERGEFAPDAMASMESLHQRYLERRLPYGELTKMLPAAYVDGLRGRDHLEHDRLAVAFLKTTEFSSALTTLGTTILQVLSPKRPIMGIFVSGAPAAVLRAYSSQKPIIAVHAVEPAISEGRFVGRLADNPAMTNRKRELAQALRRNHNVLFAVGDSESDRPLLDAAMVKVAVGASLGQGWPSTATILRLDDATIGTGKRADVERWLGNQLRLAGDTLIGDADDSFGS